ncbi:MAG: hypothetical protein JKX92_12240 [Porticoccaceae bacterium]|nr:hypothetical protein [Porticoccaceae bacterium]
MTVKKSGGSGTRKTANKTIKGGRQTSFLQQNIRRGYKTKVTKTRDTQPPPGQKPSKEK